MVDENRTIWFHFADDIIMQDNVIARKAIQQEVREHRASKKVTEEHLDMHDHHVPEEAPAKKEGHAHGHKEEAHLDEQGHHGGEHSHAMEHDHAKIKMLQNYIQGEYTAIRSKVGIDEMTTKDLFDEGEYTMNAIQSIRPDNKKPLQVFLKAEKTKALRVKHGLDKKRVKTAFS